MKERPILFSGPMVRAILEGRKTQTRRILKPQPCELPDFNIGGLSINIHGSVYGAFSPDCPRKTCPHGQPGDRLWVRETIESLGGWTEWDDKQKGFLNADSTYSRIRYLADGNESKVFGKKPLVYRGLHLQKIPSIHMPRWASRITLEITGIRVERLQEIDEEDAVAEGIEFTGFFGCNVWNNYLVDGENFPGEPIESYRTLWESINGTGSWDANPWVWVVGFKRV